jgi:hypothetical protein
VSKKSPRIRLVPVKPIVSRERLSQAPNRFQGTLAPSTRCHFDVPAGLRGQFDCVAFFQIERAGDVGGNANG